MMKNAARMNFCLLTSYEATAASLAVIEFENWVGICWVKSVKTLMDYERSIIVMGV